MEDQQKNSNNSGQEEKKEAIKITLEGGQEFRTVVLAKQTTKIYKLLEAFCKEHKLDQKEYRLIHKDKVLHLDERLENYNDLTNDSKISVVASQVGGF